MRDDQLVAMVSLIFALILAVGKYSGIRAELRRRESQQRESTPSIQPSPEDDHDRDHHDPDHQNP